MYTNYGNMEEIYFTTDELCSLDDECNIEEVKREIDNAIESFVEWGSGYNLDRIEILADKERYILLWLRAEYGYNVEIETDISVFYSRLELARWCFEQLDSRDYYITDDPHDTEIRNNIAKLLGVE